MTNQEHAQPQWCHLDWLELLLPMTEAPCCHLGLRRGQLVFWQGREVPFSNENWPTGSVTVVSVCREMELFTLLVLVTHG